MIALVDICKKKEILGMSEQNKSPPAGLVWQDFARTLADAEEGVKRAHPTENSVSSFVSDLSSRLFYKWNEFEARHPAVSMLSTVAVLTVFVASPFIAIAPRLMREDQPQTMEQREQVRTLGSSPMRQGLEQANRPGNRGPSQGKDHQPR